MNNTLKKIIVSPMNILYKINPELELSLMFRMKNGYSLNLYNPITYNEKLQWIKLYYKDHNMPMCTDKYEVRRYVEECGCSYLLNDLLWHGFNANDIPFDDLPQQFVLKVTHGSGFNIICKDKDKLDKVESVKKLNKWLKATFLPCYGEWFYGIVKPRIIVEKLLNNDNNELPEDYKVFCFDGEPKYIIVDTDRYVEHKRNVYDLNWKWLEGYKLGFPNDKPIKRPDCLIELLSEARKLSKGFPHARIDFYIVNNRIYFGEVTFTNGAGFDKITPHSFDVAMGKLFNLPHNLV